MSRVQPARCHRGECGAVGCGAADERGAQLQRRDALLRARGGQAVTVDLSRLRALYEHRMDGIQFTMEWVEGMDLLHALFDELEAARDEVKEVDRLRSDLRQALARVNYYERGLLVMGPCKPYWLEGSDETVLSPEPTTLAAIFEELDRLRGDHHADRGTR